MKKTMLTVAVLVTMLIGSCSKSTMVGPEQPSMANAREGTSMQAVGLTTPLPSTLLPAGVKTYLDQHYAGYSVVKIDRIRQPGTTTFTGTKVKILQNGTLVDLDFDASNALIAKPAGPQGGPPSPPVTTGNHSVNYVSRAELPAVVAGVIAGSTYSTYTYGWTELHVREGVMTYDVKLFTNNQLVTLHLDANGAAITPTPPAGPVTGGPASGTVTAPGSGTATPPKPTGPASGTVTAPVSGTVTPPKPAGPVSGTITTPGSGTVTAPKPPMATAPGSSTVVPPTPASPSFILASSQLPTAIGSYLQTNFSGYLFLAAERNTSPTGTTSEYTLDIAVGKQLYKLRLTATGELLMAEARN